MHSLYHLKNSVGVCQTFNYLENEWIQSMKELNIKQGDVLSFWFIEYRIHCFRNVSQKQNKNDGKKAFRFDLRYESVSSNGLIIESVECYPIQIAINSYACRYFVTRAKDRLKWWFGCVKNANVTWAMWTFTFTSGFKHWTTLHVPKQIEIIRKRSFIYRCARTQYRIFTQHARTWKVCENI